MMKKPRERRRKSRGKKTNFHFAYGKIVSNLCDFMLIEMKFVKLQEQFHSMSFCLCVRFFKMLLLSSFRKLHTLMNDHWFTWKHNFSLSLCRCEARSISSNTHTHTQNPSRFHFDWFMNFMKMSCPALNAAATIWYTTTFIHSLNNHKISPFPSRTLSHRFGFVSARQFLTVSTLPYDHANYAPYFCVCNFRF